LSERPDAKSLDEQAPPKEMQQQEKFCFCGMRVECDNCGAGWAKSGDCCLGTHEKQESRIIRPINSQTPDEKTGMIDVSPS